MFFEGLGVVWGLLLGGLRSMVKTFWCFLFRGFMMVFTCFIWFIVVFGACFKPKP